MNLQIISFTNDFSGNYPHGNKMIVSSFHRPEPWNLFLDTDMALVQPVSFMSISRSGHVTAGLENQITWPKGPLQKVWSQIYGLFEMPIPEMIQLKWGALSYPYFNAGMVLFDNGGFGAGWLDTGRIVDAADHIEKRRPFVDQLSIGVAALRFSNGINIAPDGFNTTEGLDGGMKGRFLLHYHHWKKFNSMKISRALDPVIGKYTEYNSCLEIVQRYSNLLDKNYTQQNTDRELVNKIYRLSEEKRN